MQWHQLDHKQTICTSLQTDNHINTSSLNFYRLDALPDAEPTVSKHCNLVITTIIITIMYKFLLPLVSDGLTNNRQRVSESWLKNVCTHAHTHANTNYATRACCLFRAHGQPTATGVLPSVDQSRGTVYLWHCDQVTSWRRLSEDSWRHFCLTILIISYVDSYRDIDSYVTILPSLPT